MFGGAPADSTQGPRSAEFRGAPRRDPSQFLERAESLRADALNAPQFADSTEGSPVSERDDPARPDRTDAGEGYQFVESGLVEVEAGVGGLGNRGAQNGEDGEDGGEDEDAMHRGMKRKV